MLTLEFPTGVNQTKNTHTKCTHERERGGGGVTGQRMKKDDGEQMERTSQCVWVRVCQKLWVMGLCKVRDGLEFC